MQHLLPGDAEDDPAPPLDRRKLILAKTGTRRAFEAKRGVEVLAHQAVLKLSGLGQKVGQLLAIPHHDDRLSPHRRKVSAATAILNEQDPEKARKVAEVESPMTSARLAVMRGRAITDPTPCSRPERRLSGAVPVYAAPDQDVYGVDMSLNSVHAVAA